MAAVNAFDEAWRRGPRPAIDDHLPADDPLRSQVRVELVHVELELRLKAGEPARVEEYLARYPQLGEDRADSRAKKGPVIGSESDGGDGSP
jgi:hypothetical protein